MENNVDVVIIGGGPAGISAALWCKRLDLDHVLIEAGKRLGGQLFHIHNKIIDYPGVLVKNGEEMQRLLTEQIEIMNCNVKLDSKIISIDSQAQQINYTVDGNTEELHYKYIIFATGSKPRKLGVPGEKEMYQRGEIYSATRDKHQFIGKKIAIIGGGDRAFEGAFLLAEVGASVLLIHRSTHFRARVSYQQRVFSNNSIEVLTNTSVLAIQGDCSVKSIDILTEGAKQNIDVDAVFIRLGVKPNTKLLLNQVKTDEQGYIIVNQFGETSIPSIFAIGDVCTEPKYSSISTSVGQAMVAAKQISECLKQ